MSLLCFLTFPRLWCCFSALVLAAATAADFPEPYNSERESGGPLPPAEALASLKLPPGFTATLFAHEPMVQNPVAIAFDGPNTAFVAENYTYAEKEKRFDLALRDRLVVLRDENGDGRADSRQVFTDDVRMLTSVEVGRGGVWLMCPPQLLFIPDRDRDLKPDGPAEVVLDGFTVAQANYHNFANGLQWGPDGWLYGRCGASCPGEVGAPGTPPEARIPMRGGVWRYHPERKIFEALTHGTTNPWGHDWTELGELFFVNTVNGHLWHAFPGAHFVRPHTLDPNPHAYQLIDTHADHWHFDTGKGWQASRDGKANDLGGGHAHCGAMIYQGVLWPQEYRGKLFTLNFHGRAANVERLEPHGSGYIGRHEQNAFTWSDPWFRPVEIRQGPYESAFVLDWSDTGECHENTGVHRRSGRIYRIRYGVDGQTDEYLFDSWHARQALREVFDAAALGKKRADFVAQEPVGYTKNTEGFLRLMWLANAFGELDTASLRARLVEREEHVRVWALRLLTDAWPLDTVMSKRPRADDEAATAALLDDFIKLARQEDSGLVRLTLASILQRLPYAQRAPLAAALATRAEDAADHNLPALVWFGLIPLGDSDPAALVKVAEAAQWPDLARWIARRLALASDKAPEHLDALFSAAAKRPAALQAAVLRGAGEGFQGWRKAKKPASWDTFQAALATNSDNAIQSGLRDLSALFGDGRALDEVKRLALDSKADITARRAALETLIDNRPPDLRAICEKVLPTNFLAATALRGLSLSDDPDLGKLIAGQYGRLSRDRAALIETLVSRPPWASALLDAIAAGKIPRAELSAFHARQIRGFGNDKLTARLSEVWGEIRDSAAEKQEAVAKLKNALTPAILAKADIEHGRAAFKTVCAACHTMYGEGGALGPDLTGGGRDNLDYLLENIVDPSAVVSADFRLTTLTLKDGRILTGMISARQERTLTLKTLADVQTVERADIAKIEESAQSLMPEGLLAALSEEGVRDLIAYLMKK